MSVTLVVVAGVDLSAWLIGCALSRLLAWYLVYLLPYHPICRTFVIFPLFPSVPLPFRPPLLSCRCFHRRSCLFFYYAVPSPRYRIIPTYVCLGFGPQRPRGRPFPRARGPSCRQRCRRDRRIGYLRPCRSPGVGAALISKSARGSTRGFRLGGL